MRPRRDPAGARPRAAIAAGRGRRWSWYALAALLPLAVALAVFRQPLAERLWPSTRIDRLLAEGEHALAQERLDQADGQGARQKFEAALALDGDRGEARAGLARVGQAALTQARRATMAADPAAARRWLALARDLQVPRAQWEAEAARLRTMEAAAADLPALRARAQARLAAGDPEAALPLLARVLALEPGDAAALEGREDALSLLVERVHRALRSQDLRAANDWLRLARGYDPGHVDLPAAQAQVAQALEAGRRRAERQLRRGRPDQAAEAFRVLREIAPDDPAVAESAQRTAVALAAQARRLSADFRFDAAERELARARELAPDADAVREATRGLARDRAVARQRLVGRTPRPQAALRRALQEFDAAMARRHWIVPPGASAYDHLRTAQAIAPEAAAVRDAAQRLRAAAQDCVEEAMRGNRLHQAQDCHDAWQAVAPGDPARAAAARLAQRWLAVGEERLRAGELDAAAHALGAARRLDPSAAGIGEFAAQLDRARSAAP
ncbi:hypothetical protein B1992_14520 [Pseudoxanthomonas broegbernensis]|uniref:Tetratricopeptide repeat protein n=1 Tax=Pseudoxanthomonas broegbernensis TaxID=83619 RepID=A0A7V8K693_9GAMM|nr:hypothetical protein [Pseudoxanthomonas broegbernensis]KAF1684775.1 hypothetical protein B1992_14520 [Pseudoxanthomonas broegbernensis]MBB6064196.1 tetratricopeptide (TPR) repeat protein [Pseudoxanthomonas broegbernensis]